MIRNRTTILFLSPDGSPARAFSVSRHFLCLACIFILILFLALLWGIHEYFVLRTQVLEARDLRQYMEMRYQIAALWQAAAGETITDVAWNGNDAQYGEAGAEGEICRIAAKESLLGIGGSPPEDTDPRQVIKVIHTIKVRTIDSSPIETAHNSRTKKDAIKELIRELDQTDGRLSKLPAKLPAAGEITSGFGWRSSPFNCKREFHKGIDISAPKGTSVYAQAAGKIIFAGRSGALGNLIDGD